MTQLRTVLATREVPRLLVTLDGRAGCPRRWPPWPCCCSCAGRAAATRWPAPWPRCSPPDPGWASRRWPASWTAAASGRCWPARPRPAPPPSSCSPRSGAHHAVVSALAAAVAGLATPPLEPCLRALWPHLVPEGPVLSAAFSLDVGLQELVFVAGPLLTVAGVATLGHAGGVLACALFGLVGTVGFAVTRTSRGWRPTPSTSGVHGSPLRHGVLVRIFVVALASGVPVGALAIVAAAFADRHGSAAITGWALAANAAGALASGLYGAVRPLAQRRRRDADRGRPGPGARLPAAGVPFPVAAWIAAAALAGVALPIVLGRRVPARPAAVPAQPAHRGQRLDGHRVHGRRVGGGAARGHRRPTGCPRASAIPSDRAGRQRGHRCSAACSPTGATDVRPEP